MLEIRGIRKSFQGREVLHDIRLTIQSGEFFSLLGPSGCGKSTLLRILAGLETATAGEIYLEGKRIDQLPPQERPCNLVFQKHALFPHLSVAENVAFGLRMRKTEASARVQKVQEALALVGLSDFASRRPETLSGGQSQRVALARALVNEPRLLLLDEPLSALDLKMREHMQTELKALQKRLGITFVSVTHDQEEALVMSDRIGLMRDGRLEQVSAPREIYEAPKNVFTAGFVGRMSRLEGRVLRRDGDEAEVLLADDLRIRGRFAPEQNQTAEKVTVLIRPEKIRVLLGTEKVPDSMNQIAGDLKRSIFKGDHTEYHLESAQGVSLQAWEASSASHRESGDQIRMAFDPADTYLFVDPSE